MAARDDIDTTDAIEAMTARWLMGSPALEVSPPAWRDAMSGVASPDQELQLFALAGQFAQRALRPVPPSGLAVTTPLPALALPTLDDALRPIFRRLVAGAAKDRASQRQLVNLMAHRGVVPHPADWLPEANDDDLPAVYAPWIAWAERRKGTLLDEASVHDLTAESWDDFPPAMRRAHLDALRRADPAAARALIELKAPLVPAEERVRLVECLAPGLSETDAPWLESLLRDRSTKVKAAAQHLLGRLSRSAASDEAAELAAFLETSKKGLIRRQFVVSPLALKTAAQQTRRQALFDTVGFSALAAALAIDAATLAQAWAFGTDPLADLRFVIMAAQSAPDSIIDALIDRLVDAAADHRALIERLAPRLEPAARRTLVEILLGRTDIAFAAALAIGGPGLDVDDTRLLLGGPAGAARQALLVAEATDAEATPNGLPPYMVAIEIFALGLLAGPAAAAALLQRAGDGASLRLADPRLDMLRLNAALSSKGQS